MMLECKHGHEYTEANTSWAAHPNGKSYRQCKTCKARRNRLLYRNSHDYREREKTRALERYYTRRQTPSAAATMAVSK